MIRLIKTRIVFCIWPQKAAKVHRLHSCMLHRLSCWSLSPALDLYLGKSTTSQLVSCCRFTLITHHIVLCAAFRSCFFCFFFGSQNVCVLSVSESFNPRTQRCRWINSCSHKQQNAALRPRDVSSSICLDSTPIEGWAEVKGGEGLRGDSAASFWRAWTSDSYTIHPDSATH